MCAIYVLKRRVSIAKMHMNTGYTSDCSPNITVNWLVLMIHIPEVLSLDHRLCGLVVGVPACGSKGSGFDSRRY
jgi:hypothetical protein